MIGGEFSLSVDALLPDRPEIFTFPPGMPEHYRFFRSGRRALAWLLSTHPFHRVLLPSFLCDSVANTFIDANIQLCFYQISRQFEIDPDEIKAILESNPGIDCFYLMHYFGRLQAQDVLKQLQRICRERDIRIVEDAVHSFFTKALTIGDYGLTSLRKWAPIPGGGLLYAKKAFPCEISEQEESSYFEELSLSAYLLKDLHLHDFTKLRTTYMNLFAASEYELDYYDRGYAVSALSQRLIQSLDNRKMAAARKANARELAYLIHKKDIRVLFQNYEGDFVPFFFPIFVPNREPFMQGLRKAGVAPDVHWRFLSTRAPESEIDNYLSRHIISLPVDQRYTPHDMEILSEAVMSVSLL